MLAQWDANCFSYLVHLIVDGHVIVTAIVNNIEDVRTIARHWFEIPSGASWLDVDRLAGL